MKTLIKNIELTDDQEEVYLMVKTSAIKSGHILKEQYEQAHGRWSGTKFYRMLRELRVLGVVDFTKAEGVSVYFIQEGLEQS